MAEMRCFCSFKPLSPFLSVTRSALLPVQRERGREREEVISGGWRDDEMGGWRGRERMEREGEKRKMHGISY